MTYKKGEGPPQQERVPHRLRLAIVRTLQGAGQRLTGQQLVEALRQRGVVYSLATVQAVLREMEQAHEVDHWLKGKACGYGLIGQWVA
jgi:Fe2+ or Zn2+ uptake regulation protein